MKIKNPLDAWTESCSCRCVGFETSHSTDPCSEILTRTALHLSLVGKIGRLHACMSVLFFFGSVHGDTD